MATLRAKRKIKKLEQQRTVPNDQRKQPQGIKKERPQSSHCKSAQLQEIQRHQVQIVARDMNTKPKPSNTATYAYPEDPTIDATAKPLLKRKRTIVASSVVVDTLGQEATSSVTDNKVDPIDYWTKKGRWPEEYFKQDDQTRKHLGEDSCIQGFQDEDWFRDPFGEVSKMSHLLAQNNSSSSLRGEQPAAYFTALSSTTHSDQDPREAESTPYQSPQYKILLETKFSFMCKTDLGIADTSRTVCRTLLETEQTVPEHSLFQDDFFDETCEMIQDRNEAKVIQDIARLIVPSAQFLAIGGAKHLKALIESVNEGWDSSIALTKPRPQPDYAVGFKRTAFTVGQFKKIQPFIGGFSEMSFFMGTYFMYFPFLTCEIKCGTAALDVADRQNAHSMTMAVRGVVELFRLVKREKEIHREILAFSISHDNRTVRIYGHYPVIDGPNTTFFRHPIRAFDFTEMDGMEKWTAYKFTKNVYDKWMPTHLKRICSVIDELPPGISFEVSELPSFEASVLPQVFEDHGLSQASNPGMRSPAGNNDSQSSLSGSIIPMASLSRATEHGAFKKPKKRRAAK